MTQPIDTDAGSVLHAEPAIPGNPAVATPRPWVWRAQDGGYAYLDEAADGYSFGHIATVWGGDDGRAAENADLIVHAVNLHEELVAALRLAVKIAEEARQEWDAAPGAPAVKAGKLLIALAGHIKGYRPETDAIHAALAKAMQATSNPQEVTP